MKKSPLIFVLILFFIVPLVPVQAEAASSQDSLMPLVGDALVQVREQNWDALQETSEELETKWQQLDEHPDDSEKLVETITDQIEIIQSNLTNRTNLDTMYDEVVTLAEKIDKYEEFNSEKTTNSINREAMGNLIASLDDIKKLVSNDQLSEANAQYQSFVANWTAIEKPVRETNLKAYGSIETGMSMARVAMNAEPVEKSEAIAKIEQLQTTIQDYLDGNIEAAADSESPTLSSLLNTLASANDEISNGNIVKASDQMQRFIQSWPSVEGAVLTKSQSVYNKTENDMTGILTLLKSDNPDTDKAQQMIADMKLSLEPFTGETNYSAWDAFFVLFREGMEAILVISTFLAFLRRTDNEDKRAWVWGGFGIGILLSIGLAVVLTIVFSNIESGMNREIIEGITGLVAVIFMLSVGSWMHKQSNILSWNQYINKQMKSVMKKGTPWLLSIVTFIAVFREGAETIIFYLGMAPSITISQLLTGIGAALIALLFIGILMVKFSVKIPIRPFFMTAGILIYFIAFKFTGVGIHALQITDWLPAHHITQLPVVPFFGFYPTWETTIAQFVLLAYVIFRYVNGERKKKTLKAETA